MVLFRSMLYPITVDVCSVSPVNRHAITFLLACNTRFYPNYYVHKNATTRTYYAADTIEIVQASRHVWMERELCENVATMMVTAWYVLCAPGMLVDFYLRTGHLLPIVHGFITWGI